MSKSVSFSDITTVYDTYSNDEYPRNCIDSAIYKFSYRRITNSQWNSIFVTLDLYKLYEMKIQNNIINNKIYHFKRAIKTTGKNAIL